MNNHKEYSSMNNRKEYSSIVVKFNLSEDSKVIYTKSTVPVMVYKLRELAIASVRHEIIDGVLTVDLPAHKLLPMQVDDLVQYIDSTCRPMPVDVKIVNVDTGHTAVICKIGNTPINVTSNGSVGLHPVSYLMGNVQYLYLDGQVYITSGDRTLLYTLIDETTVVLTSIPDLEITLTAGKISYTSPTKTWTLNVKLLLDTYTLNY